MRRAASAVPLTEELELEGRWMGMTSPMCVTPPAGSAPAWLLPPYNPELAMSELRVSKEW